jgi:hypothetical protein
MNRSLIFLDRLKEFIDELEGDSYSVGIVDVGPAQKQHNHNIKQPLIRKQFDTAPTKDIAIFGNLFEFHGCQESVKQLVVSWQIMPFDMFIINTDILDFFNKIFQETIKGDLSLS